MGIQKCVCETRVHGIAASAAAIIFCAGTRGYRVAGSRAELMFHELFTFKFIAIETPSDQEDQSRILRHLQDSITAWLAKRGKMSKADLDSRMRKKELWLNGLDARNLDRGYSDRGMKEILAELRNKVIASQAIIKLVSKNLKTEESALIEIARNLIVMADLLKKADKI